MSASVADAVVFDVDAAVQSPPRGARSVAEVAVLLLLLVVADAAPAHCCANAASTSATLPGKRRCRQSGFSVKLQLVAGRSAAFPLKAAASAAVAVEEAMVGAAAGSAHTCSGI